METVNYKNPFTRKKKFTPTVKDDIEVPLKNLKTAVNALTPLELEDEDKIDEIATSIYNYYNGEKDVAEPLFKLFTDKCSIDYESYWKLIDGSEFSLRETVNINALKIIIDNFDVLKGTLGRQIDKQYATVDDNTFKTILTNNYNFYTSGKLMKYKYSSRAKQGRLFTQVVGLQGMSRVVRHTLCREHLTDIDVQNCHPIILLNYCKQNSIPCPFLQDYCKNRASWFLITQEAFGISKDMAKRIYLSFLNNGDKNFVKTKKLLWNKNTYKHEILITGDIPEQIIHFRNELTRISNIIAENHPHLKGRGFNASGSIMNQMLCIYENELLMIMVKTAKKFGIEICALVFDGLMVYNDVRTDAYIIECMKQIKKQHSLKMDCVILKKSMDEGIELDPLLYTYTELPVKIPRNYSLIYPLFNYAKKYKRIDIDYMLKDAVKVLPLDYNSIFSKYGTVVDMKAEYCNFTLDSEIIICTSDTGSGKTSRTLEIVKDFDKVIIITTRRALAYKLELDYGFENYMKIKPSKKEAEKISLINYPKIIISVNSLYRLVLNKEDKFLLVLDEVGMIFPSMTNNLIIGTVNECVNNFARLMKNATNIICTDATLTENDVRIIQYWTPCKKMTFFTNSFISNKMKNREAFLYDDKAEWDESIKNDIKNKIPIVICTMTKANVKKITANLKEEYPKLSIIGLHGATPKKELQKLLNNMDLLKVNILIYNGVIDRGISIDFIHYHKIYAWADFKSEMEPESLYQIMQRVRNPVMKEYHILLSKKLKINEPFQEKVIDEEYRAKFNLQKYMSKYQKRGLVKNPDGILDYIKEYRGEDTFKYHNAYYNTVISVRTNKINNKNFFNYYFCRILKQFNFEIKVDLSLRHACEPLKDVSVSGYIQYEENDDSLNEFIATSTDIEIVNALIKDGENAKEKKTNTTVEYKYIQVAKNYKINPYGLSDTDLYTMSRNIPAFHYYKSYLQNYKKCKNFLVENSIKESYINHIEFDSENFAKIVLREDNRLSHQLLLCLFCDLSGLSFEKLLSLEMDFEDLNLKDEMLNCDAFYLYFNFKKKPHTWIYMDFKKWISPLLSKNFMKIKSGKIIQSTINRKYTFKIYSVIEEIIEALKKDGTMDLSLYFRQINFCMELSV